MVTRLAIGKNSFPCLEIIFHRMNGTLYCQVTILYRCFSLEINYNVIVCCGFQGKRGIVKPPFELPEFIKVCSESVIALLPIVENCNCACLSNFYLKHLFVGLENFGFFNT